MSGYTICYEAKSGQGKPSPYKSTGNGKAKTRTFGNRLVLSVISAAKLRVRPDCRQIPCWLRFTAAQATLALQGPTTTNWVCLHTGN